MSAVPGSAQRQLPLGSFASPTMSVQALNAEAVLDDSIDPKGAQPLGLGPPDAIFLTGATGFLGAFLLNELAQQTSATIFCLVRATSAAEARARIQANLESYSLPLASIDRIEPVVGDLTHPLLGLAADDFRRLAESVEAIYHCGAAVKWTYPFASLRAANVGGTHEVLRLASTLTRKPVHHVSTVGVFASSPGWPRTVFETEPLDHSGPLSVGYAQTKWVAEKLVILAAARGLPTSIYRPNIACHSVTGAFNPDDHLCLMIKGCLQLGSAPVWDTQFHGAAVDYVSSAMVHLAQQPESLGRTFHLVGPQPLHWNELVSWLRERGYGLRHVPFDQWRRDLQAEVAVNRSNALFGLSPMFSDSLLERAHLPHFDCGHTVQQLDGTSIRCPAMDRALVARMLDRLIRSGYLDAPRR